MKIRIGILGYGNLGRGVESGLRQNPDMELAGIFTRRSPQDVQTLFEKEKIYHLDQALEMKDKIDVMILCGGSASDLPLQTPEFAAHFNIVNSYDKHAEIPDHFAQADKVSKEAGKISIISAGWDPGMFSINRLYGNAILPEGSDYTFWGKGVSQGHSDAIRRIPGVIDARQYTIPVEASLAAVREGQTPEFTSREKHERHCYVLAEEGADLRSIEEAIKTMPAYFADYDTVVNFISQEELERDHQKLPHGGFVIRSGRTGAEKEHKQVIEYSLKLDSNPEFTASVLLACARAAHRLYQEGQKGCKTIFDIAPAYLSPEKHEDLLKKYL